MAITFHKIYFFLFYFVIVLWWFMRLLSGFYYTSCIKIYLAFAAVMCPQIHTHSSVMSHFPYSPCPETVKPTSYLSLTSLYWFTCKENIYKNKCVICWLVLLKRVRKLCFETPNNWFFSSAFSNKSWTESRHKQMFPSLASRSQPVFPWKLQI